MKTVRGSAFLLGLIAACTFYDPTGSPGIDSSGTDASSTTPDVTSPPTPTATGAETGTGVTTGPGPADTDTGSTAADPGSTTITTDTTDATSSEPVGPDAPTLQLAFSPIKHFDFSWAPVVGATHYRLLERPPDAADYAMIGADIVGESVSLERPLHLRFGASYVLQACDVDACTDSAPVEVVDSLAAAVGYFKASNTDANDLFGASLALSADGMTLAVGAPFEDSSATGIDGDQSDDSAADSGAVYVFRRVGGVWTQDAYLKAANTGAGDRFGASVALAADGDTLVVGAWAEDSSDPNEPDSDASTDSGAAYVFVRDANTWMQETYLKAPSQGADEKFGTSLALSASGDTLAVSAVNDNGGVGAVHVYARSGGKWPHKDMLTAPFPDPTDGFGLSLAMASDGLTLAIGAWREDSNASGVANVASDDDSLADAGAAYVFVSLGGVWMLDAYVKPDNPRAGDQFGYSLALAGAGDTLAVSARFEDSAATDIHPTSIDDASAADAGAVYLFTRANDGWSQLAYVKPPNTGTGDLFGESLAMSSDGRTLAIGALLEDGSTVGIDGSLVDNLATNAGAVYVYTLARDTWTYRSYVKASNTDADDAFAVAAALWQCPASC